MYEALKKKNNTISKNRLKRAVGRFKWNYESICMIMSLILVWKAPIILFIPFCPIRCNGCYLSGTWCLFNPVKNLLGRQRRIASPCPRVQFVFKGVAVCSISNLSINTAERVRNGLGCCNRENVLSCCLLYCTEP